MKIQVDLRRGANGWVQAFCPDVPGCSAIGRTESEAISALRQRIEWSFGKGTTPPAPDARRITLEL